MQECKMQDCKKLKLNFQKPDFPKNLHDLFGLHLFILYLCIVESEPEMTA